MKRLIILGTVLLLGFNTGRAQNSVSGYVVSLETAEPIEGATMFLKDRQGLFLEEPLKATSDSTGFYEITGIEAGAYILNAWTSYRVIDQRYAQVLQTNRIEVDRVLTVDLVLSENALKYRLHYEDHPWEAFRPEKKRTSDDVAFRAVRPQIYVNYERVSLGASYIANITDVREK